MNSTIRPYQAQDLGDLLTAWEKSSRLAHPFMKEEFFAQERDNIPNIYIPNTDTWVAVVNNRVVGFIALIVGEAEIGQRCEIGGLFVEPSFHRQSIGKLLVKKATELYGDSIVKVFKKNTLGRAFYDKQGFTFVGETIWEETGDVLIEMKLTA